MKLYASLASSFARKIRIMLIEKKVGHEVEMVNLFEPNSLHEANPIGFITLRAPHFFPAQADRTAASLSDSAALRTAPIHSPSPASEGRKRRGLSRCDRGA